MDLKSGKTDLISTGEGQTTCAWIHPLDRKVLFSSTHLDPNKDKKKEKEWEERKDPKRAYSWDFDETYDDKQLKSYQTFIENRKSKTEVSTLEILKVIRKVLEKKKKDCTPEEILST